MSKKNLFLSTSLVLSLGSLVAEAPTVTNEGETGTTSSMTGFFESATNLSLKKLSHMLDLGEDVERLKKVGATAPAAFERLLHKVSGFLATRDAFNKFAQKNRGFADAPAIDYIDHFKGTIEEDKINLDKLSSEFKANVVVLEDKHLTAGNEVALGDKDTVELQFTRAITDTEFTELLKNLNPASDNDKVKHLRLHNLTVDTDNGAATLDLSALAKLTNLESVYLPMVIQGNHSHTLDVSNVPAEFKLGAYNTNHYTVAGTMTKQELVWLGNVTDTNAGYDSNKHTWSAVTGSLGNSFKNWNFTELEGLASQFVRIDTEAVQPSAANGAMTFDSAQMANPRLTVYTSGAKAQTTLNVVGHAHNVEKDFGNKDSLDGHAAGKYAALFAQVISKTAGTPPTYGDNAIATIDVSGVKGAQKIHLGYQDWRALNEVTAWTGYSHESGKHLFGYRKARWMKDPTNSVTVGGTQLVINGVHAARGGEWFVASGDIDPANFDAATTIKSKAMVRVEGDLKTKSLKTLVSNLRGIDQNSNKLVTHLDMSLLKGTGTTVTTVELAKDMAITDLHLPDFATAVTLAESTALNRLGVYKDVTFADTGTAEQQAAWRELSLEFHGFGWGRDGAIDGLGNGGAPFLAELRKVAGEARRATFGGKADFLYASDEDVYLYSITDKSSPKSSPVFNKVENVADISTAVGEGISNNTEELKHPTRYKELDYRLEITDAAYDSVNNVLLELQEGDDTAYLLGDGTVNVTIDGDIDVIVPADVKKLFINDFDLFSQFVKDDKFRLKFEGDDQVIILDGDMKMQNARDAHKFYDALAKMAARDDGVPAEVNFNLYSSASKEYYFSADALAAMRKKGIKLTGVTTEDNRAFWFDGTNAINLFVENPENVDVLQKKEVAAEEVNKANLAFGGRLWNADLREVTLVPQGNATSWMYTNAEQFVTGDKNNLTKLVDTWNRNADAPELLRKLDISMLEGDSFVVNCITPDDKKVTFNELYVSDAQLASPNVKFTNTLGTDFNTGDQAVATFGIAGEITDAAVTDPDGENTKRAAFVKNVNMLIDDGNSGVNPLNLSRAWLPESGAKHLSMIKDDKASPTAADLKVATIQSTAVPIAVGGGNVTLVDITFKYTEAAKRVVYYDALPKSNSTLAAKVETNAGTDGYTLGLGVYVKAGEEFWGASYDNTGSFVFQNFRDGASNYNFTNAKRVIVRGKADDADQHQTGVSYVGINHGDFSAMNNAAINAFVVAEGKHTTPIEINAGNLPAPVNFSPIQEKVLAIIGPAEKQVKITGDLFSNRGGGAGSAYLYLPDVTDSDPGKWLKDDGSLNVTEGTTAPTTEKPFTLDDGSTKNPEDLLVVQFGKGGRLRYFKRGTNGDWKEK